MFFKSVLKVGIMTLISRILGLIRDTLSAIILGVSPYSDAFFIAFKLPNVFRRLFAEGSLNTVFVPTFAGLINNGEAKEAKRFANEVFTIFFISLLIIIGVMEIFMPRVIAILAPGFSRKYHDAYRLAVDLSRISLPYLFFIALATIFSSILNSLKKFTVVAILPLILNLSLIVFFVFSRYVHLALAGPYFGAIAISFAGVIQLAIIVFFAKRSGWKLKLVNVTKISAATKRFFVSVTPVIFTAGIYQINVFIDITIASWLTEGAITYLYYGDRLNQLPLAIIGIATSTVIVSFISGGKVNNANNKDTNKIKLDALLFGIILGIPAVISFFILGREIIDMLFHHGAFNQTSVDNTYKVLCAYALGLVPNIIIKVMVAIFCAGHKAKIPFIVNINMLIVNIGLAILLSLHFSYIGIAVATSITAFFNVGILGFLLLKHKLLYFCKYFFKELFKGLVVIIVIFGLVWLLKHNVSNLLKASLKYSNYLEYTMLLGLIALIIIVFMWGLKLVNSSIYFEIMANIVRKKK